MRLSLLALLMLIITVSVYGQKDTTAQELDKLRTESGVDPTRVSSRVSFSGYTLSPAGDNFSVTNRARLTLGVDRWSFSLRYEYASKYTGADNKGVVSGSNDMLLTFLNAFYTEGKSALAGSFEFVIPSGSKGFSNEYFSVTPSLVYSYTISPSLIVAVQPQYTFHIFKNKQYPDLSVFTGRPFIALFLKGGWFYVLEPRQVYDFTAKKYDLIIAPVVGKSLGGGFNLAALAEIPTRKDTFDSKGPMIVLGINKNF